MVDTITFIPSILNLVILAMLDSTYSTILYNNKKTTTHTRYFKASIISKQDHMMPKISNLYIPLSFPYLLAWLLRDWSRSCGHRRGPKLINLLNHRGSP